MDELSNYQKIGTPIYKRLSDSQCDYLYTASLEILERIGIRYEDEEAINLLRNAGGYIINENRVGIPSRLVKWALNSAPSQIFIYNQKGKPTIKLGKNQYYFGVGSDGNYIIDHRTGERREGKLSDVEDAMKICDYLPNIDFVMSMLIPKDVPQRIMDRYQMKIMLSSTNKPIIIVNTDLSGMKDSIKMAEIVAGGENELRNKPFLVSFNNVSKPLLHNIESTQKILYAAEKGIPSILLPAKSMKGAISPVTTPAYLALSYACQLSGLVLSQLKREGSPFIFEGAGGGNFDMLTTNACVYVPENRGFAADLSRYLNMPIFGQGGGSDSKIVDGQATAEAALSILLQALSGAGLIHDIGYIESHGTQSFEMLVICNEIISWVKKYMKSIEINEETLAIDVIEEIEKGTDEDYLGHKHTYKHYREEWYPELFDRSRYSDWERKGKKSINQRAKEKVEIILNTHKPETLSYELQDKLDSFIESL